MQTYLRRHDIVFASPQTGGAEGLPLGNGDLAAMVWTEKESVRLQINKADLWTQPRGEAPMLLRSAAAVRIDLGCPVFDDIQLERFCLRLSPADGVVTLTAQTPFAAVRLTLRALRGVNGIVGRLCTRGCGSVRFHLERYGSRAFPFWYHVIDPQAAQGLGNARVFAREGKLALREGFFQEGDRAAAVSVSLWEDTLRDLSGRVSAGLANRRHGELTVQDLEETQETESTFFICCGSGETEGTAEADCARAEEACQKRHEALLRETEGYWKRFWNDTRLILGQSDPAWDYLENLYVMQRYMMACGCGKVYPMIFNGGTFTWNADIRQWGNPHHWNTHMVYNGTPDTLNCPEMMEGYLNAYWRILPQARAFAAEKGAPGGIAVSEMHDFAGRMLAYPGALTPAAHIALIFWDHYLFELDEAYLRERAYPFMKAAAAFYLRYAKEDGGVFHIYPAGVYECEFGEDFRDTAPDLSAVRALFPACIRASEILDTDEDEREVWQDFLSRLAPYTFRTNGRGEEVLAVGRDRSGNAADFKEQNETFLRNCAHVYPWHVTGIADRGSRLYRAACHALPDYRPTAVAISPTPVAYARLGFGGKEIFRFLTGAARQLQHFPQGLYYNLDHWSQYSRYFDKEKTFLTAQRDYMYDARCRYEGIETGTGTCVLPMQPFVQCGFETPAILLMALHESALQSAGGQISVFPVTDLFGDCAFTLRARGGFLVSALQRSGATVPAAGIVSQKGAPCRVDLAPFGGAARVYRLEPGAPEASPGGTGRLKEIGTFQDTADFATRPGGRYLLIGSGAEDLPEPAARAGDFLRAAGVNRRCKTFGEAILGREDHFGRTQDVP